MSIILNIIRSFRVAFGGLVHAFRSDKSFRLEVLVGLPLYLLLARILAPLSPVEWILFVGSYFIILIVELLNTSIETLLDRLHPEKHELIAKSKDIASAAVLLSFLLAGIVVLTLYFAHPPLVFQGGTLIPFA
jgi:diacylglycerol kinase (ATP)